MEQDMGLDVGMLYGNTIWECKVDNQSNLDLECVALLIDCNFIFIR